MKRRLSLSIVTIAAGLSLGSLAVAPSAAATPDKGADATTTSGWRVCIYGPPIGSMTFNFCWP